MEQDHSETADRAGAWVPVEGGKALLAEVCAAAEVLVVGGACAAVGIPPAPFRKTQRQEFTPMTVHLCKPKKLNSSKSSNGLKNN